MKSAEVRSAELLGIIYQRVEGIPLNPAIKSDPLEETRLTILLPRSTIHVTVPVDRRGHLNRTQGNRVGTPRSILEDIVLMAHLESIGCGPFSDTTGLPRPSEEVENLVGVCIGGALMEATQRARLHELATKASALLPVEEETEFRFLLKAFAPLYWYDFKTRR